MSHLNIEMISVTIKLIVFVSCSKNEDSAVDDVSVYLLFFSLHDYYYF